MSSSQDYQALADKVSSRELYIAFLREVVKGLRAGDSYFPQGLSAVAHLDALYGWLADAPLQDADLDSSGVWRAIAQGTLAAFFYD